MDSTLDDLEELLARALMSLSDLAGCLNTKKKDQRAVLAAKQKIFEIMRIMREVEL